MLIAKFVCEKGDFYTEGVGALYSESPLSIPKNSQKFSKAH